MMLEPLDSTLDSDVSSSYQSDVDVVYERLDSTIDSDVSSSYQSDGNVYKSYLAESSQSSTSTDREDNRGLGSRTGGYECFPHLSHEEWEELSHTDFKAIDGCVMIYPKTAGEYVTKNFENIMSGLYAIAEATSSVIHICDCLRNTLGNSNHQRKPSNLLFDVCMFRVDRPSLVISVQRSSDGEDTVNYNTKIARELTGSIRAHRIRNFNLVHGVLDAGSDGQTVKDVVSNLEENARDEFQVQTLNMNEKQCSDIVSHFAHRISRLEVSLPESDPVCEEKIIAAEDVTEVEQSYYEKESSRDCHEDYVETAAYRKAKTRLYQHGFVTITGLPGDGKTYIAYMLSNEYKKLGYELLSITSPVHCDLESRVNDKQKYICIFDDIFRNEHDAESMKSVLNFLMLHTNAPGISAQKSERKFVAVFTSQVFNLFEGIKTLLDRSMFIPETIINLSKMKYNSSETKGIFMMQYKLQKKRLPEKSDIAFVSKIGQEIPGFPLLCRLYFEGDHQYSCVEFFKHPLTYFRRVFDNIIKTNSSGFAAAALVFLCGRSINFCDVEEGFDDYEVLSKLRDLVPNITLIDICSAIRRFRDIFFTTGESIAFQNNAVYDAFACSLFELNRSLVLKHCTVKFLCDRVSSDIVLETFIDERNVLHLSDHYHSIVASRLVHELEGGHFKLALSPQLLLQDCFVDEVFKHVKLQGLKSLFDEGKHFLFWTVKLDSPALLKRVLSIVDDLPFETKEGCIESCLISGDHDEGYVVTSGHTVSVTDSCLLLAVELKCLKDTEFLFDSGAKCFTTNRKNQNIFHLACANNHKEMVSLIIRHCNSKSVISLINTRDGSNHTPVMIAALNGDEEIFHVLQSAKADLYLKRYDDTMLHLGCDGGSTSIAEYLLGISFDVNSRGKDDTTPLMRAAAKGHIDVVNLLLSRGADQSLKDNEGDLAVHYSCRGVSVTTVRRLVALGDIDVRGKDGMTPVMVSALAGDMAIFQFLVARRADLSQSDSHNNTVIHYASKGGNCDIVRTVLSRYNINSRGEHGRTPVMMAAANGHPEVVDFLISENADLSVTDKHNNTILHIAFDKRNSDVIASVKRHVDINQRDVHGLTPIMIAAMKGNAPVFDCLLDNGADTSLCDYRQNTMQHFACAGGNKDIVDTVKCRLGLDWNKSGATMRTPIMMAAEAGHQNIVEFLVGEGADIRKEDANGNNILHLACHSGNRNLVEYLLPCFHINTKGENRWTPLMTAAVYGHTKLFKFLLREGAAHNLKDTRGNTCMDLATKSNRVDIIEYVFSQHLVHPATLEKRVLEVAAEHGHEQLFFKVLEMRFDRKRAKPQRSMHMLHKACKGGSVQIVQYILRHENPAINSRDVAGRTPVLIAAERDHTEIFHLLVQEGCNLSLEDKSGNTILHTACRGGSKDIVKWILTTETGRELINRRRTSDGFTPIMVLVVSNKFSEEIFKILTGSDLDLSVTDNMGNSILHLATRFMRAECVKYLLTNGLDMNAENKSKKTPLSLTVYTTSSIKDLYQEFQDHGSSNW